MKPTESYKGFPESMIAVLKSAVAPPLTPNNAPGASQAWAPSTDPKSAKKARRAAAQRLADVGAIGLVCARWFS